MMRGRLIVCLIAGALSACGYDDRQAPPSVALPERWDFSATGPTWPDGHWWQGFGSQELDGIIVEAGSANGQVAAATARVRQAAALTRIAGAPLFPSVNVGSAISRDSENGSGTFGSSSGTFGDLTLSASYEIDFWGRNHATLAAAKESLKASEFDRQVLALTITAGAADAYFEILSVRERLALAQQNVANAHAVLNQVEARARAGTALAREVAQQRALLATQEATIPPLAQAETATLSALAVLLDKPPQSILVSGTGLDALGAPALGAGLPADLLTRRPDIAAAEARLAAADANIAVARAAMLPRVNLNGSVGPQIAAVSGESLATGLLYGLAAGLTQPIFNGGALAGQKDLAVAQKEELVAEYRTALVSAVADVETALGAVNRLKLQEAKQEAVVRESQRAFDLADTEYRAGAEELLTVLDVQRTLFQAQDGLVQLKLARLEAAVALFKALGGGWNVADTGR